MMMIINMVWKSWTNRIDVAIAIPSHCRSFRHINGHYHLTFILQTKPTNKPFQSISIHNPFYRQHLAINLNYVLSLFSFTTMIIACNEWMDGWKNGEEWKFREKQCSCCVCVVWWLFDARKMIFIYFFSPTLVNRIKFLFFVVWQKTDRETTIATTTRRKNIWQYQCE